MEEQGEEERGRQGRVVKYGGDGGEEEGGGTGGGGKRKGPVEEFIC